MKPDWRDAPEWARWLAQDADGDWYWYGVRPSVIGDFWTRGEPMELAATVHPIHWRDTLEKRP